MKKFLVSLLILVSCSNNVTPCNDIKFYHSEIDSTKDKNVILFHGIWSDSTFWNTGHANDLVKYFKDKDYQIILADYNYTDEKFFNDGGKCYREKFKEFSKSLLSKISGKIIVGGFSFGGLHALVMSNDNSKIDSYFSLMPSLNINILFKDKKIEHFNAYSLDNLDRNNLIISGSSDEICSSNNIALWSDKNSLNHKVIDIDHRINDQVVNEVINWNEGIYGSL